MKKPTLKKGDVVFVVGRRWFDRVNGNTYHTAEVEVNGEYVGKSRMTYGYGDNYLETAKEILLEKYNFPKGMTERSSLFQLREYGVVLNKSVIDGLKRDLETGGTIIGTAETPLARGLGISYTGLVGETGAMSSGEMFAGGGGLKQEGYYVFSNKRNVIISDGFKTENEAKTFMYDYFEKNPDFSLSIKKYEQGGSLVDGYLTDPNFGDFQAGVYADGGSTGLPEGTQQHFVNYYLGEGTAQGIYAEGGGVKKRSLKSVIHLVDWKGEGIKKWYLRSYPTDEMGEELNDTVTFKDLWDSLNAKKNVYEIMGVGDSLIRERLFEYLSLIYNVDYDVVYNKWLESADYAKGGGVRMVGNREYPTGRAWTNEHRHIDKADSREVNYTRKKSFDGGGGIEDNAPSVYIADLEAYNNGRLVGKWFNLLDYSDADEFNEAVADFLKETGAEEYAVHDFENIPRSMQSEYLGVKDFEEIYEMIDLARDKDLPLEVVMEVVSQYDASAVDNFYGVYDSEEDFAQQLVDDLGIESLNNFEYYLEISDTDRRLLAQDMADSYVDDIKYEDGGNRLIEEAGLDVEEYEEADEDRQEEMRDEATEIVYDQYYDTWYDGLDDPYYFLVEEQGLYSADDFAKASFVRVDIEKLARELEYDYNFIKYDGLVYVFSFR
jgi:antirestriction protein